MVKYSYPFLLYLSCFVLQPSCILSSSAEEDIHIHFHLGESPSELKPENDLSPKQYGEEQFGMDSNFFQHFGTFNLGQGGDKGVNLGQGGHNGDNLGLDGDQGEHLGQDGDKDDKDSDTECSCGKKMMKKEEEQNRIIGGSSAKENEFPWVVRITGGCAQGWCGGALISPRLLLSSYHCSYTPGATGIKPCDHSDERRLAVLGRHTYNERKLSSYYTIPIIDVKYPDHGQHILTGDYESHDFVMFVLKTPAKFSDKVGSICLPEQDSDFGGQPATAAGWGRTAAPEVSSLQSPVLKSVRLTVGKKKYKHYKMFGTKLEKKNGIYQDACSGDSGGPLMYYNHSTSSYILIGTVQGTGYDCQTDTATLYEDSDNGMWNKVSHWVDWIKEQMKEMGETSCQSQRLI